MDEAQNFMAGVKRIEAEVQRRQKLLGDHLQKRKAFNDHLESFLPHVRLVVKVKEHRKLITPEAMLQEMREVLQTQSNLLTELEALRSQTTQAFPDIDGLTENHLQMGDLVLKHISEAFERTMDVHRHGLDELLDLYNVLKS